MTIGGKSDSGTFKIQGSKNGTAFTDLVNSFSHSSVLQTFEAINKEQYNYYRVYITGATTDINNGITPGIITFQIYGSEVV